MEIGSTGIGFLFFTTYLVGGLEEHNDMASIYIENVLHLLQPIFQFLDMRERLNRASKDVFNRRGWWKSGK